MLRRLTRLVFLTSPLLLTACEAMTGVAPKGTPRVEAELALVVSPGFQNPLVDADARLFDAMRGVIEERADIGLRLFPVWSEAYGPEDDRPPYLLTVELESLEVFVETDETGGGDEPLVIETYVDAVQLGVHASFERRRDNGPALLVASASDSVRARGERDEEDLRTGITYSSGPGPNDPPVLQDDVLRALDGAVRGALKDLRNPIDRELAPLAVEPAAPAGAEAR